jgi:hypothetical protein
MGRAGHPFILRDPVTTKKSDDRLGTLLNLTGIGCRGRLSRFGTAMMLLLLRSCSPESRIDVGKDTVPAFDLCQTSLLSDGQLSGVVKGLPEAFDLVELITMCHEACLCIISRCAGGH